MFGLPPGPGLVIFRERIVLYCEPGAHSGDRVESLLAQVRSLDMDAVRAAIEAEKQAAVALQMRRVCPTARRGPTARELSGSRRPAAPRGTSMSERYASFPAFYRFYLSEHSNRTCRRLHFVGTSLGLVCLAVAFATRPLVAHRCSAWSSGTPSPGRAISSSRSNRPATFRYPLYSFLGDWVMWRDIARVGRIKFCTAAA